MMEGRFDPTNSFYRCVLLVARFWEDSYGDDKYRVSVQKLTIGLLPGAIKSLGSKSFLPLPTR